MNLGAVIALFKLAQDSGLTPRPERPSFFRRDKVTPKVVTYVTPKKITLPIPILTYEQTLDGGPSIIGLRRPKGLD